MPVNYFSKYFSPIFCKAVERRRRDLNPRAAINDLHPFQGCPFSLLGTSPRLNLICGGCRFLYFVWFRNPFVRKRRGWDSNPRALADKRFSRPPRYDHFDTSPGPAFPFESPKCKSNSTIIPKVCQLKICRLLRVFLSAAAHPFGAGSRLFASSSASRRSSGVVIFKLA